MRARIRFLAIGLILAIGLVWGCGSQPAPEPTTDESAPAEADAGIIVLSAELQQRARLVVEPAARRTLEQRLQFSGTIQANQNQLAHVGSRIGGRITEVAADLGARVATGQKLAALDSPELGQAQSDFLTARARMTVAEKAYERARTLLEGKVIGAGEFQRREGEYLALRAELQAVENRLHLLGMSDDEARALANGHAIRSQVAIAAPFAGTVIERHVTLGEVVESGEALFTIADLSMLWGIADVPEQAIARVKKGLAVSISVSAYPGDVFEGKVSHVADVVDPATRTVKARVEVDNRGGRLKPEMFASFTLRLPEGGTVLTAPEAAVQRVGTQAVVFVRQGEDRFEKRSVELGALHDGYYEVRSGLQPGEPVVTEGAFVLKSEALKGLMEEE